MQLEMPLMNNGGYYGCNVLCPATGDSIYLWCMQPMVSIFWRPSAMLKNGSTSTVMLIKKNTNMMTRYGFSCEFDEQRPFKYQISKLPTNFEIIGCVHHIYPPPCGSCLWTGRIWWTSPCNWPRQR
jgi:hypothetical protein